MVVLIINIVINLFLTPFILEQLGTEAYGFVGLVNNFVSYITVVTVALNALSGRYITLAYHKGRKNKVLEYYSSIFFANIILSCVVFFASILLILNMEYLFNVSSELVRDVKITILLAFINTIISLIEAVFGIAAFIKNKLYCNSIAIMVSNLTRMCVIVVAFNLFVPHMWYYAGAGVVGTLILFVFQVIITHRLLPEISISKRHVKLSSVLKILKSGIWVSVESLNKILQTGLDLLITNLFADVMAMGLFSVAKSLPTVLGQIPAIIASNFNPKLAKLYAENNSKEIINLFKFTIRFLTFIMIVPLMGFMVFGFDFYTLWINKSADEIKTIQILSILSVLPLLVNAYVEGLYYANTLTNKIKNSVLITFIFSVTSILIEILLLNVTGWNPLYVIAGTSSFFMIVRYLIITPIYCSYVLNLPWYTFYTSLFRSLGVSLIIFLVFFATHKVLFINNWVKLFIYCGIAGIIGYIIVYFTLFNKRERGIVLTMVNTKFRKLRNKSLK